MRGGRVRERRPSNKTIRHTKQREYLIFSSKGNLNTPPSFCIQRHSEHFHRQWWRETFYIGGANSSNRMIRVVFRPPLANSRPFLAPSSEILEELSPLVGSMGWGL